VDASTVLTGQDIRLPAPQGPPAGTSVTPSRSNDQGVPVVFWGESFRIVTQGCPGGTATFAVMHGARTIASGPMTEAPSGTYTATVPALAPSSGYAHVRLRIDCPGATPDQASDFNVYIDPSGTVRTTEGDRIAGATVVLYRSDSPNGPFEAVPDNSDIMSPSNRRNPDTTGADGHFGWDVVAGYYKVHARADGCVNPDDPTQEWVETAVLTIPPPVTDLDLRLACARAPGSPGGPGGPGGPENPEPVPPTLTLTMEPFPAWSAFVPGVDADYSVSTTARVTSTAGDTTLTVVDPSPVHTGHLVNGPVRLPSPLMARATTSWAPDQPYQPVGSVANPLALLAWHQPVNDESVTISLRQHIGATDALRRGSYGKSLTFTVSTSTP
jgi:hypothetical protein